MVRKIVRLFQKGMKRPNFIVLLAEKIMCGYSVIP